MALPEEIEEVRNILTPKSLWQTFDGDDYDVWAVKVINLLKLHDLWHFIVEENPIDPKKFNALIEFEKEKRQVVALNIIQDSIDYSNFQYIVEVDTPKRAWDTLKEVFSEEPTVEEDEFASQAKHGESHSELEDSQDECVYEAVSDQVITTKVVDPVVLVDDNKLVNVVVLSDVSDSLSEQETIDSSIEATIVTKNEKQPLDNSTKETTTCSPSQNQKTRSLREIYE